MVRILKKIRVIVLCVNFLLSTYLVTASLNYASEKEVLILNEKIVALKEYMGADLTMESPEYRAIMESGKEVYLRQFRLEVVDGLILLSILSFFIGFFMNRENLVLVIGSFFPLLLIGAVMNHYYLLFPLVLFLVSRFVGSKIKT